MSDINSRCDIVLTVTWEELTEKNFKINLRLLKLIQTFSVELQFQICTIKFHHLSWKIINQILYAAIHTGWNKITFNEDIDAQQLVNSIIDIGKICKSQSIKDILISSNLVRFLWNKARIYAQVIKFFSSLSKENDFYFLSHQDITRKHLSHDNVHLSNDGTHMFPDNLVETDILITMTLITDKFFFFRFMK